LVCVALASCAGSWLLLLLLLNLVSPLLPGRLLQRGIASIKLAPWCCQSSERRNNSNMHCCCHAPQVSLLAATNLPEDSSQPGSATVVRGQPFTIPTAMGALAPPRAAAPQQRRLAPGAIAGIVIGSVAGAALLAAAAVFGYKKTKRHR
jgi:hypothetical protein